MTPNQLAQEAKRLADEYAEERQRPMGLCRPACQEALAVFHASIDSMAKRIAELTKRAESAEALIKRYREALLTARDALACSYDVDSYPANGKTKQDKAIVAIDAALQQEKSK